MVIGQAILFRSFLLVGYALLVWGVVYLFVVFVDVFVNDIGGQFRIRIGARDSFEHVTDNQIWGPCDNKKGGHPTGCATRCKQASNKVREGDY